jgi:hypothetical protein
MQEFDFIKDIDTVKRLHKYNLMNDDHLIYNVVYFDFIDYINAGIGINYVNYLDLMIYHYSTSFTNFYELLSCLVYNNKNDLIKMIYKHPDIHYAINDINFILFNESCKYGNIEIFDYVLEKIDPNILQNNYFPCIKYATLGLYKKEKSKYEYIIKKLLNVCKISTEDTYNLIKTSILQRSSLNLLNELTVSPDDYKKLLHFTTTDYDLDSSKSSSLKPILSGS